MRNFETHVKSDTVKWVLTLIGFILVAVVLAGVICGWFERKEPAAEEEQPAETGGLFVDRERDENGGLSLCSTVIPRSQYEDYGIMPVAASAVTVSVNNASDFLNYNWALAWKTSKPDAVTNYVQLSASTGASVNVSALKAFDTQVILTCTASFKEGNHKTASSATCTVDYAPKLEGITFNGTRVTEGQVIELATLLGEDKDIVDALEECNFAIAGAFGIGSLSNPTSTLSGTATAKSVMEMTYNDCTGKLPAFSLSLAGFIHDQMYLSADYYIEQMLLGDEYAISLLESCVSGYDKDIEFTVEYTCGENSGTLKFYVNISDSLFGNYAAQNVQLDRAGIVL